MSVTRLAAVGALAFGVLTVVLPSSAAGRPTTYAAASTGSAIADLTAGLSLLVAGAVVTVSRRHGSVGPITILLGVTWLAHDWVGWDHGWAAARTAANLAAPLTPALLAHLAVAFPSGRVASSGARAMVAAAYAVSAALAIGVVLVGDPALDRYCWANCSDNVLLLHSEVQLAQQLARLGLWAAVATGGAVIAWCGWRTWRATRVARRLRRGVLVAVAGAAGLEAAYAVLLLVDPAEDPARTDFVVVFLLRAALLTCFAVAMVRFLVSSSRTIARVEGLSERMGAAPPPGTLRDELARTLGDDELQVAYWLPGPARWSDASGRRIDTIPGVGRATTTIARGGRPVALVTHDAELLAMGDLADRIGAAARLAVDNERLQAQLLARLDEVRASRARIVDASDTFRRRLERDLHDGIQHRMLAVAYELHQARQSSNTPDLAATVAAVDDETLKALTDLRELAQGIFPAILTDAGLPEALRTLAARAPTELAIGPVTEGRFPAPVECAAYAVVSFAVDSAAEHGATHVAVSIVTDGGDLVVRLTDDAATRQELPLGVHDRVAAVGGWIQDDPSGTEVRIPCDW